MNLSAHTKPPWYGVQPSLIDPNFICWEMAVRLDGGSSTASISTMTSHGVDEVLAAMGLTTGISLDEVLLSATGIMAEHLGYELRHLSPF